MKAFRIATRSLRRPLAFYRPCIHQPHRYATTYSTPTQRFKDNWNAAKKDNPILLPILLIGALASSSLLGLLLWDDYKKRSVEVSPFPKPVDNQLRLALHYTHVDPNPEQAQKFFTEAIRAAEQCELDPFGKEVLGIRIRLAEMLEKFGYVRSSVEVLTGIIKDCEEKLEEVDKDTPNLDREQSLQLRTGLLRNIIQARVKASALYESNYMQNTTKAKETLSDAVGLLVKETRDAQTSGFSENNAAGLSLAEIASMLSQMGDLYATSGEESNAVQVYMLTLQPLRASCNGTRSCKEAQILSNIASTMDIALKKPGAVINGKPPTKASLEAARRAILKWADQAIATAEVVKPEDRDQICELSLLSASMTKADMLLDSGKNIQAREAFRALIPSLKDKGLDTLVKVAEEGVRRAGG